MKSRQNGFTLIELVMVIVILGVLAAVAIPKFTNLSTDANAAAVTSVAGSLAAGAATNYAVRSARGATADSVAITTCASVIGTLQGGLLPAGAGGAYDVFSATAGDGGTVAIAANATVTCNLRFVPTSGTAVTSTFSVTGIA